MRQLTIPSWCHVDVTASYKGHSRPGLTWAVVVELDILSVLPARQVVTREWRCWRKMIFSLNSVSILNCETLWLHTLLRTALWKGLLGALPGTHWTKSFMTFQVRREPVVTPHNAPGAVPSQQSLYYLWIYRALLVSGTDFKPYCYEIGHFQNFEYINGGWIS